MESVNWNETGGTMVLTKGWAIYWAGFVALVCSAWADPCAYRQDLKRPATHEERLQCEKGLREVSQMKEQVTKNIYRLGAEIKSGQLWKAEK